MSEAELLDEEPAGGAAEGDRGEDENSPRPPGDDPGAGLRSTARRVGKNSIIYFIAEGGVRAATLIVTPLYTHVLTPRDYGILAVTSSASLVVTLLLSLALDDALGRLTLELKTEAERRRLCGTILTFLLTAPLVLAVVLELLGDAGYLNFFRAVPYSPYLRYALWTGYLAVFPFLPITLYMTLGQPRKVLTLRYLTITVQVGTGVVLILFLHQGVLGALRGLLAGAAASAVVAVFLIARRSTFRPSRTLLMAAFAFCLPILPHALSNWVLMLSDRVVLQRYVNDTQLGLYQLGYLVGGAATLFTNAAAAAQSPIIYWRLRSDDPAIRAQVPALGTYILLVLTFLCLSLAIFGGTAIRVLTPASYLGAIKIVPWVASSYIFVAAYIVMTTGLWMSMKTRWLATGTLLAAAVNVGATFLFGSMFGIVGAGLSTLIGYAFLALVQGLFADHLYPIPWEYGRWGKLLIVAGACLALGLIVGNAFSVLSIALRLAVMGLVFPLLLFAVNFWSAHERGVMRRRGGALATALRRRSTAPLRGSS